MLKEYGVDKPPPIIVKNSITFCKRVYDEWKERIFYAVSFLLLYHKKKTPLNVRK